MTTDADAHTQFLADPEGHAAHRETCGECRALVQSLDTPVDGKGIEFEELPVAAWEGAAYRSWPFVAAVSAIVAGVAIALCHMAGVSPLHVMSLDASINSWRAVLSVLTGALQRAPLGVQILFAIAFVVVNSILFVLLRRPTRGIDA